MNKAIRCETRDQFGHRCARKKGHERVTPSPDRPKDVRDHTAFGRSWPAADPLTAVRRRGKRKAA